MGEDEYGYDHMENSEHGNIVTKCLVQNCCVPNYGSASMVSVTITE